MVSLRFICCSLAALALTACVGGGIRAGVGSGQERWQLSGKIGLRAPQLAESAYVNWRQCGDRLAVRISGPLGQTVARIDGGPESLMLQFEGREPVATSEPESLMREQLGWSLPLRALRYWVRAQAAPGTAAEFSGPQQQPDSLRQAGWQIDYLAYHQHPAPQVAADNTAQPRDVTALPAKLRLDGGENLRVTLLINEWLLGAAADCPALTN